MELQMQHHYVHHVLRRAPEAWPEPVSRSFAHINPAIYVPMQRSSELRASGKLLTWDRTADLPNISVPTLVIGARHDTMDPGHMEMMASNISRGTYLCCPDGSHLARHDDQVVYFEDLVDFVRNVERGAIVGT